MADHPEGEDLKSTITWALGEVGSSNAIDAKLHSILSFLLERLSLADRIIEALPPEELKTAMIAADADASAPGHDIKRAGWTRKGPWWRDEEPPPADDP
ncbi:hypothetical protein [Mesorhizobium sp. IMUNJ 23232]|uniref:hypothetical protein n=1 Tax=Mesorhizobium sp. IMUNJ 23232 TaxID=3376064 RepID=UPI00378794FF